MYINTSYVTLTLVSCSPVSKTKTADTTNYILKMLSEVSLVLENETFISLWTVFIVTKTFKSKWIHTTIIMRSLSLNYDILMHD